MPNIEVPDPEFEEFQVCSLERILNDILLVRGTAKEIDLHLVRNGRRALIAIYSQRVIKKALELLLELRGNPIDKTEDSELCEERAWLQYGVHRAMVNAEPGNRYMASRVLQRLNGIKG